MAKGQEINFGRGSGGTEGRGCVSQNAAEALSPLTAHAGDKLMRN